MSVTTNGVQAQEGNDLLRLSKTITFTGAANLGATGVVPIYVTTGEVEVVSFVPVCTVDVVGAGPISLGVTGSTALFLANTVGTVIDLDKFWVNTTPVANGVAIPAAFKNIAITDDIIGTVTVAALTGGAVRFDVWYRALSANGALA